jgi:branched-chain amino acid transport system substrate-binding protein
MPGGKNRGRKESNLLTNQNRGRRSKMKRERKGVTRRTFLKKGLVIGGAAAVGLPSFSWRTLHAQPKEVKIGMIAPLTGTAARWGQSSYKGFQLAAEMINEQGGIKSMGGARVRIVVADTESKPDVAGIQAEKLSADRDILVLGGTNQSAGGMVASQVAERNQICFITGIDQVPMITERGFKFTYRTCSIFSTLCRDMIYFAKEMGQQTGRVAKKMAILCENAIAGKEAAELLGKYGEEAGFDIVDRSTYQASTTRDFTGYISKYKSAGVDLLVGHNLFQDGVLISRTMKELNFNPLAWGGILGQMTTPEFYRTLGKDITYFMGVTNSPGSSKKIPGLEKIIARYKDEADPSLIYGFSVVPVVHATLEKYPTYDRIAFKNGLDKIELEFGEYNFLQMDGLKWDSKHDNARAKAFIIQWKDGVMVPIAPAKYAEMKPVWPRPTWDEIKKM